MKKILPVVLICFCTFTSLAQNKATPNLPVILVKDGRLECATPTPLPAIAEQQEKLMQQFIQRGSNLVSPVAIPIKAHIVRTSSGTGGLSTDVLNAAIATMNTKYATLNMSFYLCGGIHYIDSDAFYNTDVNKENDLLVLNNVNDALNIYFVGNLTAGSSGLNGISAFPSADPLDNRMIMYNTATSNGVTLAHEMGHYWNLYHTHETFLGAELVNGFNCSTKGDLVCDTPADPCCYFYNTSTCTYTGTGTDANGQTYNPLINNLMSYYGLCRSTFTPGQYTRMDAGYALRMGYTGPNTYNFACSTAGAAPSNLTLSQSSCSVTLNWTDNANNEMGYIIEASPTSTGPFVAIGRVPANTTTYVDGRVLTTNSTYYYRVIAANSNATYSNTANILVNWTTNCYCTPATQSCGEGVQINKVVIKQGSTTLLESISTCAAVNGYSYPHTTVPSLPKNNTFSLSVSNPNYYLLGAAAWIDYDRSGTFDADEKILTKGNGDWVTETVNFTVPNDAVEGLTRMRVRVSSNSAVGDACNNVNGYGETEDYLVYIGCNLAPVTTVAGNRCGTGTVNLTASGCTGGTINWYSSLTGASIGTGNAFTTPSISATGTYYAGCTLASCLSSRTPAVATVYNVTLNGTGASRCGPGTLTLTVTGCAGGTIKWYAAASGGSVISTGASFTTPTLSNSRTYYAGCTLGPCSGTLLGMAATVNPIPGAPGTTGGSRCGSGQVTLMASGCTGGTIKWYITLTGGSSLYTGGTFTTPGISTSTTYYAECTVNNCASSRTSAIATIDSPSAAPGATGASRCGPGKVTLAASGCAGGTIRWYTASSGGSAVGTGSSFLTPDLSTSTTYYVACVSGSCESGRTPVVATVNVNLSFGAVAQSAGNYRVSQTITSAANVATGTNYYAGKSIILSPGFQAGSSEVFTATIQNCQ